MILRNLLFILIFGLTLFCISCQDDTITFPKYCEEPDFSFRKAYLKIASENTTFDTISIDKKGYILGDSIKISQNGISKNAKIGGHICKDGTFRIDIAYNDTVDISKLRLEGQIMSNNVISGKFLYCSNIDNNCNYIQIGDIDGYYGGYYEGAFHTPPSATATGAGSSSFTQAPSSRRTAPSCAKAPRFQASAKSTGASRARSAAARRARSAQVSELGFSSS